jgi:hypothetical protein
MSMRQGVNSIIMCVSMYTVYIRVCVCVCVYKRIYICIYHFDQIIETKEMVREQKYVHFTYKKICTVYVHKEKPTARRGGGGGFGGGFIRIQRIHSACGLYYTIIYDILY